MRRAWYALLLGLTLVGVCAGLLTALMREYLTPSVVIDAAPDTALLYALRNDLALNGPKYGCGLGECGACAVLIDGVAARSCVIPI